MRAGRTAARDAYYAPRLPPGDGAHEPGAADLARYRERRKARRPFGSV